LVADRSIVRTGAYSQSSGNDNGYRTVQIFAGIPGLRILAMSEGLPANAYDTNSAVN
jgi:hypothetical protein